MPGEMRDDFPPRTPIQPQMLQNLGAAQQSGANMEHLQMMQQKNAQMSQNQQQMMNLAQMNSNLFYKQQGIMQ
jgi:uncharacterized protein YigA (DUF484 family)